MNLIQELLPIIIIGYIINIILGLVSVIKAFFIIKKNFKFILFTKDIVKPLVGMRNKYISWTRQHLTILSLLFPYCYILMTFKELYLLYKVHYNIVYLLIYEMEREILLSSLKLTDKDKETLNIVKGKLHYPTSLSLIDTSKKQI